MAKSKYYALEVSEPERTANITIYGDITSLPWLESDVTSYNLSKVLDGLDVDLINVNINSYGGEVAEGLAIYNALKRHRATIRTRVDGFACSIASVIFAAGDERVMNDASLLMIHNAWQRAKGNAAELRKAADDLDKINDASVKAYMAVAKVDESEIRALMDGESWIDPAQAVELGLATSIEGEESDKPSQSVRRKVMNMIRNPYMMDDPDDRKKEPDGPGRCAEPDGPEDPDDPGKTDDPENPDGPDDPGEPAAPDDPSEPSEPANPDDPDDPENPDDPKDPDDQDAQQFFIRAIMSL